MISRITKWIDRFWFELACAVSCALALLMFAVVAIIVTY
jgi:hypothetical protein